jgi:hypothetical protein
MLGPELLVGLSGWFFHLPRLRHGIGVCNGSKTLG